MKKKKVLVISVITVLVVAVAVLLGILLWPKKSNKQVYSDAIKESFNFVTDKNGSGAKGISSLQDIITSKIVKIAVDGKGAFDFGDLEMYFGDGDFYATLDDGKDFVADVLFRDEKLYLNVEDVFKSYYYLTMDDLDLDLDSIGNLDFLSDFDLEKIEEFGENVQKISDIVLDSLLSTIENKNVKKEDSTITINSKKYDTSRLSYTFTGEDLYDTINNVVSKIKKDKELYSLFEELFDSVDMDGLTFDQFMDGMTSGMDEVKSYGDLFTYTIYLKGNDLISTQISIAQIPGTLVINNIENDYFEAYVSMGKNKLLSFVVDTEGKKSEIELTVQGETILDGVIEKDDDELSFEFNVDNEKFIPFVLKLEGEFEIKGELDAEGTIKFKVESDEIKSGELHIKVSEENKMPKIDVSDAKPYTEMSQSEQDALYNIGFGNRYYELDF